MNTIRIISSMATRHILNALAEACDEPIDVLSVGGVDAAKRIAAGEAFDIACLAAGALEKLEADGHIVAGSIAPLARSEIAVATRAGAAAPRLESGADVRAAMLAARSVGYSTGPSGDHILRLWADWGITEQMKGRAVLAPAGVPVASLVASGAAELGLQQRSELIGQPGIDIAGPLPADVQLATIFALAVCTRTARPDDALRAIGALRSPDFAPIIARYGMERA